MECEACNTPEDEVEALIEAKGVTVCDSCYHDGALEDIEESCWQP